MEEIFKIDIHSSLEKDGKYKLIRPLLIFTETEAIKIIYHSFTQEEGFGLNL